MKTTSSTVCAPRMWLFRPLAAKFRGVLLLLLLFDMASSAAAWSSAETATHDPTQLPPLLTGSEGAGAGKLIWAKENWLKTSY